ncbi:MAG: LacI family DNA-binding transcriptional regulator [Chloroflexota bacterium]
MPIQKSKDRKQAVTMTEIARLAGVSQSTVSRVLNGSTHVIPEKKAAVLQIIERFNYRPNIAAQGLVSGKTLQIGVLTRHLGSPYFSEILRGIAVAMDGSNYHPVIGLGSESPREDRSALELLLSRGVDGIILQAPQHVQGIDGDYLCDLAEAIPLIVIGACIPGIENQCLRVKNFEGGYLATSYLIENGHIAIAHITGKMPIEDAVQRRAGYCQALIDHGLEVVPELIIEGNFSESIGAEAVETLLAHSARYPFSAIFVANDQAAVGVRLALFYKGIAVPEQVSLVGFDDLPGTQYMIPPLTTIRQPVFQMGMMASQAVLALAAGEEIHLDEIPLELITRQSVAFRKNIHL